MHLIQAQGTDKGHTGLVAGVAASIHEHRDKPHEHRTGCQSVLKAVDDHSGKGSGEHQQKQPRDAAYHRLPHAGAEVRLVRRVDTGHMLEVLGSLLLDDVDSIVDGNDTHQPVFVIHDWHGQKVVFAKALGHVFPVLHGGGGNDIGLHDLFDHVGLVRKQQSPDRYQAQQVTAGVSNIADVDGLLVHTGAANALDGVLHGHVPFQVHELCGHDRTGGVLGIFENLINALAGLGVGVTEDALNHGGRHLLDQIDSIVYVQLVQDFFQLGIGKGLDEQFLLLGVHFHKSFGGQFLGEQAVDQGETILGQFSQNGGDIGRLKEEQHVPYFLPSLSNRQFLYFFHDAAVF